MAPLQQMVGQDLDDHLRKKTVEEKLQSGLPLLQAAEEAIEMERMRRDKDDAANDALASAAGHPEPDLAVKLTKTAEDDEPKTLSPRSSVPDPTTTETER